MKPHSLGVLSFALALIGVATAADPYGPCRGSNYGGAGDCPYGYNCVTINPGYSICLPQGSYAPPSYTPPGSSVSVYVSPSPGTSSEYVPPSSSTSVEYVPPSSSSEYVPPSSSTSAEYVPPSSSSEYVSSNSTTSSDYVPPSSSTGSVYTLPSPISSSPFNSVPYPTYNEPSPTSDYVPPSYTVPPGETSYIPDTGEPSYVPQDPYESSSSVVIVPPVVTGTPGSYTPVVGAPGVELRLPIDELQSNHPDVWNMFCLGLESMMAVEESIDISYYQIAGIHGLPHIPWQYPVSSAQDPSRGYCTHGSALFSTWHRPYLILLEQILVDHAVAEAEKFTGPDAQKYKDAAKKVRMPYWDWAAESTKSHLPAVVMVETLSVIKPAPGTGEPAPTTIPNPLFSYKFTRQDFRDQYFDEGFFRDTDSTRRQPDGARNSRNDLADQEMANTYESRRQNTFNLFSIPTFQGFSSNAWDGGSAPNAWTSVEFIHNNVHGNIGGSFGHMSWVDYAAFDPIFWLHHCQVDRLTAMYQAVWPGNKVQPQQASGTFARLTTEGDLDTIDTPLYPFRHPDGVEWTSNDVSDAQSIYRYGYAYPEVPPDYQGRSNDDLRLFTTEKVNELYRPVLSQSITEPEGDQVRREWIAHMAVDQSEIPGDFDTMLFVGPVPEAVSEWSTAPELVGGMMTFGADGEDMHHVIRGTVPLTEVLVTNGVGLDPLDVVEYLRTNCSWVIRQGGYSVSVTELKTLKIGFSSADVVYPSDYSKLPEWRRAYTHYDITEGREGGLQPNETYLVDSEDAPPVLNTTATDTPDVPDNSTVISRRARRALHRLRV